MEYKRSPRSGQSPCDHKTQPNCDQDVDCFWGRDRDSNQFRCFQRSQINRIEDGTSLRNEILRRTPDVISKNILSFLSFDNTISSNYPANPQYALEALANLNIRKAESLRDMARFLNKLPNTKDAFNQEVMAILRQHLNSIETKSTLHNFIRSLGESGNMFFITKLLKGRRKFMKPLISGLASEGHQQIVLYLLRELGFNQDLLNWALEHASSGGHFDFSRNLIELGATAINNALISAAAYGHVDLVQFFISRGARSFSDALVQASENGYSDIVQIIIDQGDISTEDLNDALSAAILARRMSVVELLIRAGASDQYGYLDAMVDDEDYDYDDYDDDDDDDNKDNIMYQID